jgi:chromosome segregation ATPase
MQKNKDRLSNHQLTKLQLSSNPIRRKEEKDFIIELKARNETLVLEQKRLQSRLKAASISIKKYKQEIESLTRRRIGKFLSSAPIDKKQHLSGCRQSVICDESEKENVCYSSPKDYFTELNERLALTQEEVARLKIENKNLRESQADLYDGRRPFEAEKMERKDNIHNLDQHSMEIEYRNLEAASINQMQVQQEMRQKLNACNDYITSLQTKLNNLEKTGAQHQGHDRMDELLEENKMLEEKLAKLCQLPFIQDQNKSVAEEKYIREIEELENEVDCYTEQVHVLSLDNNTLRYEMEAMEQKFRILLQERNELLENANTTNVEMRVAAVQTSQTEGRDPFTQTESTIDVCDKSVSAIDSTNQEEHLNEIQNLQYTIKDLQLNEAFKSEKIHSIKETLKCGNCSRNPLLSLEPDETLLYITVKNASISTLEKSFQGKSFVVLDILNFESQISNILEGPEPQYNFTCAFELKFTGFLLYQLEKSNAWVEIYQIIEEKITLIGQAEIKTQTLITSQEQPQTLSLYSSDGKSVGSIDVHMHLLQGFPRI